MPIRRNPVVRAGAILRKGGVHRQSTSGKRHRSKRSLTEEVDDWYADSHTPVESVAQSVDDKQQDVSAECTVGNDHSGNGKGRESVPDGLSDCLIHEYALMNYLRLNRFLSRADARLPQVGRVL